MKTPTIRLDERRLDKLMAAMQAIEKHCRENMIPRLAASTMSAPYLMQDARIDDEPFEMRLYPDGKIKVIFEPHKSLSYVFDLDHKAYENKSSIPMFNDENAYRRCSTNPASQKCMLMMIEAWRDLKSGLEAKIREIEDADAEIDGVLDRFAAENAMDPVPSN